MDVQYPYLRRRRDQKGLIRIEVMADSMRVGKTTAVRVLAQGLRDIGHVVTESYEDWEHNPHLKGSYSDPAKNFLDSQTWFARRKFEQVREGAKEGIFLQDVAPEMDYCYAATNVRLGRMSPDNFASYDAYFRQLPWTDAPAPDILVYLKVSDDVLIERAQASRRDFETVDTEYFLTMKQVNREWLTSAGEAGYSLMEIDTDNLNFAENSLAQEKLIHLVSQNISF